MMVIVDIERAGEHFQQTGDDVEFLQHVGHLEGIQRRLQRRYSADRCNIFIRRNQPSITATAIRKVSQNTDVLSNSDGIITTFDPLSARPLDVIINVLVA
mmetsp:Transcript_13804/g.20825  ORF Transcript_13804/g.20825 Transcript_13804/m.20825 type:complete len:100 (+) Transcript_13804:93-392(+)